MKIPAPLPHCIRSIIATAAVLLSAAAASADTYTWDPSATAGVQSGSGAWNTTAGNTVWTTDNGASNVLWNNGGGNSAIFAGDDSGGTVSLGVPVTISGTGNFIYFANSGYTLRADTAKTITFSNSTALLVASGKSMTIGSNVTLSNPVIGAKGSAMGTVNIDSGGKVTSSGTLGIFGNGTIIDVKAGGTIAPGGTLGLGDTGDNVSLIVDGGAVTITGGGNGNLSLLNGIATTNASATVTINSGSITLGNSNTSGLVMGSTNDAASSTTFNLNGGVVEVGSVREVNAGFKVVSTFNFNGGTLKTGATNVSTTGSAKNFMDYLDHVYVKAGGAIIDTSNGTTANNITIASALDHDATLGATVDGGLEKIGVGTLTLTGANTYTGATVVTAGGLATDATGTFGNGNITVGANTSLTLGNNTSVADTALLVFDSTSTVNLSFTGEEVLGSLQVSGGPSIGAGTYTDAQLNDFFGGSVFSGTGSLTVLTAIPETSTWALLAGAVSLAGAVMPRLRKRSRS